MANSALLTTQAVVEIAIAINIEVKMARFIISSLISSLYFSNSNSKRNPDLVCLIEDKGYTSQKWDEIATLTALLPDRCDPGVIKCVSHSQAPYVLCYL